MNTLRLKFQGVRIIRFRSIPLLAAVAALPCSALADSVAVLPFFNLSNRESLEWIGESLAETIGETLSAGGLLALGREERQEAFRRLAIRNYALLTRATVIKIGETLDVSHIVYGQFETLTPGTLRINTRILDLKNLRKGPEFEETGVVEDFAAIEGRLAWRTLRFLTPQTTLTEEEFRGRRLDIRVDAIEKYVRGLVAESPAARHRYFTQAARLDARFSKPCFQLGRMYAGKKDWRVAAGWLERVGPEDPHYREAQFLLGICRYRTGNYAGAIENLERVSKDVPLNEVLNNLAAAQSRRNLPEAVENFRRALEGDGADPDYHFNLGYALWKNRDFAAAADRFRAALDRSPEDAEAVLLLGRCLAKTGPRQGDPKSDGLERLKLNYAEMAYRQLQAELKPKR
jgi:Flp pilus assembly protein TadD/TolB-like protein